jgi:hypothetical protein
LLCAVFVAIALAGAVVVSHPSDAGAAEQPVLTVSPNSGPVGHYVDVQVIAPTNTTCLSPVFTIGGQEPYSEVTSLQTFTGSFSDRFVIPAFTHGSKGIGQVTPGRYEFTVSCGGVNGPTFTAPFEVTSSTPPVSRFVGLTSDPSGSGYWLAPAGGGVYSFGDVGFYGSAATYHLAAPIVGIAATPDGGGYWLAGADGGVFAFGDAHFYGSLPGLHIIPAAPIVAIVANPKGGGYWLVGADGGVFSFGSSPYYGSASQPFNPGEANTPVSAMAAAPDGGGYIEAGGFYGGYGYGDLAGAHDYGPQSGWYPQLSAETGVAVAASGQGQWYVASDGGVVTVRAPFYGSLPGHVTPNAPTVAIAATADYRGYWLLGADGGVFAFGDAHFYGSGVGLPW